MLVPSGAVACIPLPACEHLFWPGLAAADAHGCHQLLWGQTVLAGPSGAQGVHAGLVYTGRCWTERENKQDLG